MKTKLLMLLVLLGSLWTSNLYAQTRYPKREFRGAWIQCVNGQFQGMPTEKMKKVLVSQLDNLQKAWYQCHHFSGEGRGGCLV